MQPADGAIIAAMEPIHAAGPFALAILGGGAAGTLAAIQALRAAAAGDTIALVEPDEPGAGIAYATRRPEHLLNVPAAKMSGLPDAPEDFLDFLVEAGSVPGLSRQALGRAYVPRLHYAAYLRRRLAQAQAASPARLLHLRARAVGLQVIDDQVQVRLDDGRTVQAPRAVLALGNTPRPLPAAIAGDVAAAALVAACQDGWPPPPAGDEVAIVGSGLSMVDAVLALLAQGHAGTIHVVSRHGLMPLAHADTAPAPFDPSPWPELPLRARMRALRTQVRRARADGLPWQAVMERIRPLGQALWQSLSEADQRRFLRHVVRYWDIHRHRIDAGVHARLQALCDQGLLVLHRARVTGLEDAHGRVRLHARRRDGRTLALEVACVVNATGLETRATALADPLLRQLLDDGLAVPGPHGLGLLSDAGGALVDAGGHPQPRLRVIGSLRIGTLWETIAIPELRVQAQQAVATG